MREQMIDIDRLFLGGEAEGSTTSWKRASADSPLKADCVLRMKKFVEYWVIIRKTGNNISVTAGFYCSIFIPRYPRLSSAKLHRLPSRTFKYWHAGLLMLLAYYRVPPHPSSKTSNSG